MAKLYNEGELVVLTFAVEPASDKLESPQYDLDARYLGRICTVNSYNNSLYEVTDIKNGTMHTLTDKEFARLSDINIGMFSYVVRQYFSQFDTESVITDSPERNKDYIDLVVFDRASKAAPRTINLVHLRGDEYVSVDSLPMEIEFKDIRKGDKIRRTIQREFSEVARTGIVEHLNAAFAETKDGWVLADNGESNRQVPQTIELMYRAPINSYAKMLIGTAVEDVSTGFTYFKTHKNQWVRYNITGGGIVDKYPEFWRDDQYLFDLGDAAMIVKEGTVELNIG